MLEPAADPIVQRLHKLTAAINSSGIECKDNKTKNFLAREGLLDALLVLYDECNNDGFKKNNHISKFVAKYKPTIDELRRLRVNLNDFEQKKVIGKGTFGVVQVVREKQTGNVYALKILQKAETLTQQHVSFYEEERDIMAKATSPWITHMQYAFQDERNLYIVMDFHPGGDLLSLLDRFNYIFSEEMMRFYLAEITIAVHALHSMGYVHRDIKPDNILIDRCGHLKLADFGSAAKLISPHMEMAVGTQDYFAPELLTTANKKCDVEPMYWVKCDFWSLGIMAYEMLYGETPFKGETAMTTFDNIMNHESKLSFGGSENEVSDAAKDLIKGLLSPAPKRLCYNEVIRHKFFFHTDFNNLESVQPPFIPVVTSVDDTSNFEEFEYKQATASALEMLRGKQDLFSGIQLPFVGFTYTRPGNSEPKKDDVGLDSSICASLNSTLVQNKDYSQLEQELKAKKKELHEAQLKVQSLRAEHRRQSGVSETERRALRAEKKSHNLEAEIDTLRKEVTDLNNRLIKQKDNLAFEKAERAKTEAKTLEFLKGIKAKWKKEEEEKIKHYKEKIDLYQKSAVALHDQKDEALRQLKDVNLEATSLKTEALKYKQLFKEKEKECLKISSGATKACVQKGESSVEEIALKKQVDKAAAEVRKVREIQTGLWRQIDDLKEENSELKVLQSEREKDEAERKCLEREVEGMRGKLNEMRREKQQLGAQVEEKEKNLEGKDDVVGQLKKEMKSKQQECNELKIKLQEISHSLRESLSSQQEAFDLKLISREEELKSVTIDREELVLELSTISSREDEQRGKIEELESLLVSLKDTLNNFQMQQADNEERNHEHRSLAQLELVEKQLKGTQEAAAADREKLHTTENALRKVTREMGDAKLDLRGVERELKQSQETVQFLRERSRELKECLKEKEDEIKKWEIKEGDFDERMREKETHITSINKKTEDLEQLYKRKTSESEDETKEREKLRTKIRELEGQVVAAKNETDKMEIQKRGVESKLQLTERASEKAAQTTSSLRNAIQDLETKLAVANTLVQNLKDVCSEQDEQLSAVERFQDKLEDFAREKESLNKTIEKGTSELKVAKVSCNEEKSLRLFSEKRVRDLEGELSSVDQEYDHQKMNFHQQINDLKQENATLQAQISDLSADLRDASANSRSLSHECSELENQLELINDEVKGHIEQIHSLKDSNFKLTDGLEQAIHKGELFKQRIEELERESKECGAIFEDKETRLKETVGQQIKLIHFLQAKIENPPKKKAILSRMFGESKGRENCGYMVGHQYRKLEEMLAREKAHTKQLSTQLSKAHAELVQLKAQGNTGSLKQKKALDDISNSPQMHNSHPKERMRHKIPHRWQTYLVMRAGRCSGCLGSIPFSTNAVKCQECALMAHTKCSRNMASTCGLPEAFANHYKQSQSKTTMKGACGGKGDAGGREEDKDFAHKGWIKVPRSGKANWEKRYAVLTSTELRFYDQEYVPSLKPLKAVSLDSSVTSSHVLHSVPMSELPNTHMADFPYVLKINIRQGSSDVVQDIIYLMASSFEEKQAWILALESVVEQHHKESTASEGDLLKGVIETETLISLNSVTSLDINTVVALNDKTVVVGAVEGLFSFGEDETGKLKFRARVEGISSVYEIILAQAVGVAVFIGGKDNNLYHSNLSLLLVGAEASQMAKPSVAVEAVDPKISCHLISVSRRSKRVFMCAAASNRISIFVWNGDRATFEVCRQYSTQEPCSCFQFTPSSLIVGAERFYKINLRNFSIEEYLDESDTSLAYAIYGSAQMSSFPVAIIQVSGSGKHEEYLLVFYEFGIFVDAEGKRSREFDLKFERLPIGIVFCPPCLYILHHNSVEVLEIRPESFTKVRGMSFDSDTECAPIVRSATTMLHKPRFLGNNLSSTAIILAVNFEDHIEILSLSASFPFDPDLSLTLSMNSSIQNQQNIGDMSRNTSVCSDASTSTNNTDTANSSLKRTKFPNFMRASKRTKKQGK